MLRISKLTDYGVVLSTYLASCDQPQAARDIALQTQIPEPTVGKVLRTLARAGVVASHRGAQGGYTLSRAPELIGIQDVIEALEGPIAVTECSDDTTEGLCEHESNCGVRANWQRINTAVQQALANITVADMVGGSPVGLVKIALSSDEANQRRAAISAQRS